ncbi:hypothetical protein KSS87_017561, partial [Heliosperma pusillum]
MGNEARKTHCHTRSYNATMDSLFTQRVTMQTMGNETRKTYCSNKELQCKQWLMKQGRLIVH